MNGAPLTTQGGQITTQHRMLGFNYRRFLLFWLVHNSGAPLPSTTAGHCHCRSLCHTTGPLQVIATADFVRTHFGSYLVVALQVIAMQIVSVPTLTLTSLGAGGASMH